MGIYIWAFGAEHIYQRYNVSNPTPPPPPHIILCLLSLLVEV